MLDKLLCYCFTKLDVLEHLSHLVYLVGTAFNFELLNKFFLVVPRNGSLVQQSRSKLLLVCLQESVSAVQAAEQVNNGIKSPLNVIV